MKKLVKSYREMIDSTEKRPEFLLGLIFGLIVAMVGFIAMIELGGLWIDAPRPSDLASRLLGVGRLSLSAIAGVSLGMLIAGLVTDLGVACAEARLRVSREIPRLATR